MMTSAEIRQSFLDFFKSKQHSIVPSSSLMPDAPNLLFTNAGMNQFVPIFLGQRKPDVDKWPGAIPGLPTRAADTQKCIRAGGKHNDLEDVGLDTYHHTFFEMLGNWSFGDYFKEDAIQWAWELVTDKKWFGFPPNRLYATVFCPHMDMKRWNEELSGYVDSAQKALDGWDVNLGTVSGTLPGAMAAILSPKKGTDAGTSVFEFSDRWSAFEWAKLFLKAGLDPLVRIIPGNKKDNFWMMGDTGPCGPCSEIHVDLTPAGDTKGSLVNKGDARCIEIWNLVFIQFNANPDGTFSALPARHVDTGMGFERVTSIIQCTDGFTDFVNPKISNYETDIFRPIFDGLEKLSGKKYGSTLPKALGSASVPVASEQTQVDVAFRVIADHIRTLSFAIADGILPSNEGRGYVLRRILRRAVRYGRTLGFHEPFFYKLADVLADTMGDVFPEIREKQRQVQEVVRVEEEAFNKTLDRGIEIFEEIAQSRQAAARTAIKVEVESIGGGQNAEAAAAGWALFGSLGVKAAKPLTSRVEEASVFPAEEAFKLYDTYGFPLDLTELMARERGLTVDIRGFNKLMDEQKARARAAQKKEVIAVEDSVDVMTKFVGYDRLETNCRLVVFETVGGSPTGAGAKHFAVVDVSPMYAEMGGQVGDTGWLYRGDSPKPIRVLNTFKRGAAFYLQVEFGDQVMPGSSFPFPVAVQGEPARLVVDRPRREAIQRHHTVTHLFHWALHEVVSKDATQKGSYVGPDKLTFDFNSAPLMPQQIADIEKLVNERILENTGVSWTEVPYTDVKSRKDILQFFGDKYGDTVRVVQIGGHAAKLDGYSMELCGGTHTRATGEIGLFRIVGESAIAAGVRRVEAVAGLEAYRKATDELHLIKALAGKVNSPVHELEKRIEAMLTHQKELEKQVKSAVQKEATQTARSLLSRATTIDNIPVIITDISIPDSDTIQAVADALKSEFKGVVVLGGVANNAVALVATVSPEFTAKIQAGKIIQQIAPIVGGKGGGRPDNARGGGKDASKLDEALAKVASLLS